MDQFFVSTAGNAFCTHREKLDSFVTKGDKASYLWGFTLQRDPKNLPL